MEWRKSKVGERIWYCGDYRIIQYLSAPLNLYILRRKKLPLDKQSIKITEITAPNFEEALEKASQYIKEIDFNVFIDEMD